MISRALNTSWFILARARLGAHWQFKALAIPTFMTAFFLAYFHLLENPLAPVTVMPLGMLDALFDFHPAALAPYVSLWFYVSLAPALLLGRRELVSYCGSATALAIAGLGIFLLWPTAVPPNTVDWSLYPALAFLKEVDAAGNACPSLHVAFALFTSIWLERLLRLVGAPGAIRWLSAIWCVAIVYSTLATKQHVVVDALAGLALGGAAGFITPEAVSVIARRTRPALSRRKFAFAAFVIGKALVFAFELWRKEPLWAAALFFGPDIWILAGLLLPNNTWLMPTVTRFATSEREVWLTIDDGPEPRATTELLVLLDRYGARATFFLIGEKAAAHPELVEEIVRRGHEVANHTYSHALASFWLAGRARTRREIDQCQLALGKVAPGAAVRYFRSPAGMKTAFLYRALAERGLTLIGWSGRGLECLSASIRAPLRRLRRQVRPGAILLVHESAECSVQRLELVAALLGHLSTQGYRCVIPGRGQLR